MIANRRAWATWRRFARIRFNRSLSGYSLFFTALLSFSLPTQADVQDVVIADVTTRAFSVVWVSDEAVTDATVYVYSDAGGTTPVPGLTIDLVSASIPSAHSLGIVKVDVLGLTADTLYYVKTETTGASGSVVHPAALPLLEVTTASVAGTANASGEPITNDVIVSDILHPDGATSGDGALIVLKVPSLSPHPLTAFVADGIDSPGTVVDLNNIVEDATGTNAEVAGGTVIEISEYRGLLCTNLADQKLVRLRRAPAHEETPPITEAEPPAACFSPGGTPADFNCDGVIDFVDLNEFAIKFGASINGPTPECRFSLDYDLSPDGQIDFVDLNEFAIVFGAVE